jgi:hypothetical protein
MRRESRFLHLPSLALRAAAGMTRVLSMALAEVGDRVIPDERFTRR